MKATCPTDPAHQEFITVAHVMEEWKVDSAGNFLERTDTLQTSSGPDPGNIWTCVTCNAQATVSC